MAGDLSRGVQYIAANPEQYGFEWTYAPISAKLSKSGPLVLLHRTAPRIHVRPSQVALFLATFGPEVMAKGLRLSIDISSERVVREMLKKDRGAKLAAMQERCVASVLFSVPATRTIGTRKVFIADDGSEHETAAEAIATNAAMREAEANTRARHVTEASEFLAACAGKVAPEQAREMAALRWPLAFAEVTEDEDEDEEAEAEA